MCPFSTYIRIIDIYKDCLALNIIHDERLYMYGIISVVVPNFSKEYYIILTSTGPLSTPSHGGAHQETNSRDKLKIRKSNYNGP